MVHELRGNTIFTWDQIKETLDKYKDYSKAKYTRDDILGCNRERNNPWNIIHKDSNLVTKEPLIVHWMKNC